MKNHMEGKETLPPLLIGCVFSVEEPCFKVMVYGLAFLYSYDNSNDNSFNLVRQFP